MKIIVAGTGKVGFALAKLISNQGHDVTVIEQKQESLDRVSNEMDVICVQGNAANPETLLEAGAADADLLVATVTSDEANMVSCISARHMGTRNVIARVRDPEYLSQTRFLKETLGLSAVVNPEYECAQEISRILHFPTASRVDSFSRGSVNIVEYRVPEGSCLKGLHLWELPKKTGTKILVSLVQREDDVIVPNGSFELQEDDWLSLTGSPAEMRRFFTAVGAYRKPVKRVMIMGGGKVSVYLARELLRSGMEVTIIEVDEERCRRLCELLPGAEIICGDGTRADVLEEEGLERQDAFVALAADDGDNAITSMFARRSGVEKIITKVNREYYGEILESFGLESVVSSKDIVAQQLSRYIRAMSDSGDGSMETLYRLADGKAEGLEFRIPEDAACVGVPLAKLKLKQGVLIGAVIRGAECIVPDGNTVIQAGDHIVVVARLGMVTSPDSILEDGGKGEA